METREEIDDEVCALMMDHGPDGHVDGHELITDMVMRRIAAAVGAERQRAADQCASLAWAMENGAGDPQPGGRLRQAQRQILEGKPSASYLTDEMRRIPPWA